MDEVKEVTKNENTQDAAGASENEMEMADLLGPEIRLQEGKTAHVRIIARSDEGIMVDLGMKSEGVIPASELEGIPASELEPGRDIEVMVVKLHSQQGHPIVSYRRARDERSWETLQAAHRAGTPVEGVIRKKIKGGFSVDVGSEAFLPASQLELRFVKDTDKYVGQKFPFVITQISRSPRNIVLSRRQILEGEQKKRREEVFATISEGQVVEGTVTGITDFGAFVDIGGVEGLLHIGDITWYHLKRVEEVVKPGQQVKVQILKIDREKGKISLSMKHISPRPWDGAAERYPVGLTIRGKVTSVTDFGVFVEVEPGMEGLLHVSEVSWGEHERDLKKVFKPGQEVKAKIIALYPAREKLSLSLKQLQANPWEEAHRSYSPGARVKGTITHLTPFGAFVRLPEGIEGLIHVGDLSWTKKVRHPQDVVEAGQEVEVVVLEVNPNNEKISLSLKHMAEDPFKKYHVGAVVRGTVKRAVEFGAFVELEPGIEALLRNADVALHKTEGVQEPQLKEGQEVEAKVVKCDTREHKIDISIKKLEQSRERELLKKYVNKDERPTLGQVLEENNEDRE